MAAAKAPNNILCPICKEEHPDPGFGLIGNNNGSGGTLGGRIMQGCYDGGTAKDHPLSLKRYSSAQAHHLICCEVMAEDKQWAKICEVFGYDIDCCENGVFLPGDMRVACQLKVPLHRGHHDLTKIYPTSINYVSAVTSLVDGIKRTAMDKKTCKNEKADIITKLNRKSKSIWLKLEKFTWYITKNGNHFEKGSKIGCSNERYLSHLTHIVNMKKKEVISLEITNAKNCNLNRQHNLDISKSNCFKERKGSSGCEVICKKNKIK